MEAVIGIAVLGILVAAIIGMQKLAGRAGTAIDGAFTGNTRKRGQAAIRMTTRFTAPVSGAALLARVQQTLQLGQPSAQGLKLGELSADGSMMTIIQRRGLTNALTFVIVTEATEAGCTGEATVTQWWEGDGQVTSTMHIERLHKHVAAAVEHFNGSYQTVIGEGAGR